MTLLEKNFIASFANELELLNGSDFEYLNSYVLSIIIKDEVLHKGHNLYGKPVGYTADFIADEYKIIGQCGTEIGYFDDLKKPIKDIEKAIQNHKNCETVYLFANQRATGRNLTDLASEIKEIYPIEIEIFDSEKIAKTILEKINFTNKVESILKYLPKTNEYFKILPQTNKLPSFKSKYFERGDELKIINTLKESNYIQIYGISGIGKTELTICIGNQTKEDFDTIIWLDGDLLPESFSFSSVNISKFNSSINLEFIIEQHKILLIVDNLNKNVESFLDSFERNNKKGSKCIITSLQRDISAAKSYNLGFINGEIATQILTECTIRPTNNHIEQILKSISGYPLILKILTSSVEQNDFSWDEIIQEIDSVQNFTDNRNQKLSQRIIGRFSINLKCELGWIKNISKRKISRHFFDSVLGVAGKTSLQKRALISIQDSSYYSIHQIILDSIKDEIDNSEFLVGYLEKVKKYLETNNEIKSIGFYTFLLNHKQFIEDIYNNTPYSDNLKKIILYSQIQSNDFYSNPNYLIKELQKFSFNIEASYDDLLLYIEKIEIELFNIKKDYDSYLKACKENIEELLAVLNNSKTQKVRLVLLHHIGKLLLKIKDNKTAKEYFNNTIKEEENSDHSLLQLARISLQENDIVDAKKKIDSVLSKEINLENYPLSILLAFYDLLSHKNLEDLRFKYINNNQEFFLKLFILSLNKNFDHPYRVLDKMSGHLSYNLPQLFNEICDSLPFPANIESNKQLQIAFATIQLAHFKMIKFSSVADKEEKMNELFAISEKYFTSVELDSDIDRKKLLDLYINANETEKAIKLLDQFSDKKNIYYLQNASKAYRTKDAKKSLELINEAIELLSINEVNFLKAAFLNDKSETLFELKDKKCIGALKEAISLQNNSKTITSWEKKIGEWAILFNN